MNASVIRHVGELVKFSHTIFAMPFALSALVLSLPLAHVTWLKVALIVLCIAAARTAAMAFNRLVDRHLDADNPRTCERELPRGVLSVGFVRSVVVAACVVFVGAAALLGPLPLLLSPVALALALGYSYMKRFSSLCHLALGAAVAFAPGGAWLAVGAPMGPAPWGLVAGVAAWVSGFDVLYALQDEGFDREAGLCSIPVRYGAARSLLLSAALHVVTVGCLLAVGLWLGRGTAYFVGVAVVATLLVYEHSLVKPGDLSKINKAFFDLNGYVSMGFLSCTVLDHLLRD